MEISLLSSPDDGKTIILEQLRATFYGKTGLGVVPLKLRRFRYVFFQRFYSSVVVLLFMNPGLRNNYGRIMRIASLDLFKHG
jgi:hypothetical protein